MSGKFLHVGCGSKSKDNTTRTFAQPEWIEVRFDIDEAASPEIIGSMTDMTQISDSSFDAIFSSHNLEHVYPHEVPRVLINFRRILKPEGFLVATCPDLQSVCRLVGEGKLFDPVYTSKAGPIAPIDIIYGHRTSLAHGQFFMAHRCGFTQQVLASAIRSSGFGAVAVFRRDVPYCDLWAVATVAAVGQESLSKLAEEHLPR